jgi:H+/Cl- antiporter ClcA
LGVLVLAGAVVGSLCWFVAQRLGADEHPKPAFAVAAGAVAILGAVDILLLVAVPILLVVAVAYAVIHQRRSR